MSQLQRDNLVRSLYNSCHWTVAQMTAFKKRYCNCFAISQVRCSSDELNRDLNKDVSGFSNALRNAEADGSGGAREGQIQLEFYQRKKKSRWTLFEENIPWEVWMLKVNIVKLPNEAERQKQRCTASEELADAMFTVATSMNRNEYVPRTNRAEDLDLIFNTRYTDIQPYLFKVSLPLSAHLCGSLWQLHIAH